MSEMTTPEFRAVVALHVRELRIAAHMNQTQLADACETRQAQISAIENAKARLDDEILTKLGNALGVHPAALQLPRETKPQKRNLKIGA